MTRTASVCEWLHSAFCNSWTYLTFFSWQYVYNAFCHCYTMTGFTIWHSIWLRHSASGSSAFCHPCATTGHSSHGKPAMHFATVALWPDLLYMAFFPCAILPSSTTTCQLPHCNLQRPKAIRVHTHRYTWEQNSFVTDAKTLIFYPFCTALRKDALALWEWQFWNLRWGLRWGIHERYQWNNEKCKYAS